MTRAPPTAVAFFALYLCSVFLGSGLGPVDVAAATGSVDSEDSRGSFERPWTGLTEQNLEKHDERIPPFEYRHSTSNVQPALLHEKAYRRPPDRLLSSPYVQSLKSIPHPRSDASSWSASRDPTVSSDREPRDRRTRGGSDDRVTIHRSWVDAENWRFLGKFGVTRRAAKEFEKDFEKEFENKSPPSIGKSSSTGKSTSPERLEALERVSKAMRLGTKSRSPPQSKAGSPLRSDKFSSWSVETMKEKGSTRDAKKSSISSSKRLEDADVDRATERHRSQSLQNGAKTQTLVIDGPKGKKPAARLNRVGRNFRLVGIEEGQSNPPSPLHLSDSRQASQQLTSKSSKDSGFNIIRDPVNFFATKSHSLAESHSDPSGHHPGSPSDPSRQTETATSGGRHDLGPIEEQPGKGVPKQRRGLTADLEGSRSDQWHDVDRHTTSRETRNSSLSGVETSRQTPRDLEKRSMVMYVDHPGHPSVQSSLRKRSPMETQVVTNGPGTSRPTPDGKKWHTDGTKYYDPELKLDLSPRGSDAIGTSYSQHSEPEHQSQPQTDHTPQISASSKQEAKQPPTPEAKQQPSQQPTNGVHDSTAAESRHQRRTNTGQDFQPPGSIEESHQPPATNPRKQLQKQTSGSTAAESKHQRQTNAGQNLQPPGSIEESHLPPATNPRKQLQKQTSAFESSRRSQLLSEQELQRQRAPQTQLRAPSFLEGVPHHPTVKLRKNRIGTIKTSPFGNDEEDLHPDTRRVHGMRPDGDGRPRKEWMLPHPDGNPPVPRPYVDFKDWHRAAYSLNMQRFRESRASQIARLKTTASRLAEQESPRPDEGVQHNLWLRKDQHLGQVSWNSLIRHADSWADPHGHSSLHDASRLSFNPAVRTRGPSMIKSELDDGQRKLVEQHSQFFEHAFAQARNERDKRDRAARDPDKTGHKARHLRPYGSHDRNDGVYHDYRQQGFLDQPPPPYDPRRHGVFETTHPDAPRNAKKPRKVTRAVSEAGGADYRARTDEMRRFNDLREQQMRGRRRVVKGVGGAAIGVAAVGAAVGFVAAGDKLGMEHPAPRILDQLHGHQSQPPGSQGYIAPSPTPTPGPPPGGGLKKRDLSAVAGPGRWVGTHWKA